MNDQQNPYLPPKAEVEVEKIYEAKPRPILGIVVGTFVDIGGTLFGGFLLGIVLAVVLTVQGAPSSEIESMFSESKAGSLLFNFGTVIGLMFSFFGGYSCAQISKKNVYRQGLILSCIVGIIGFFLGTAQYSIVTNILMLAVTVATIFLGIWVYARKNTYVGS